MGQDPNIPGWELFCRRPGEEERLLTITDRRFHFMILHKIRLVERLERSKPPALKQGDVVIYQLTQAPEHRPLQHASGVLKWSPSWSLPCRVVSFASRQAVKLQQMWTDTKATVVRPVSEVRLLSRRISPPLRRDALELIRHQDGTHLEVRRMKKRAREEGLKLKDAEETEW